MFTEQEIEKLMAEVILRTVKESKFSTNIKDFCGQREVDGQKAVQNAECHFVPDHDGYRTTCIFRRIHDHVY